MGGQGYTILEEWIQGAGKTPGISALDVVKVTGSRIEIEWYTTQYASSEVSYSPGSGSYLNETPKQYHEAAFTSLASGTTYTFTITSTTFGRSETAQIQATTNGSSASDQFLPLDPDDSGASCSKCTFLEAPGIAGAYPNPFQASSEVHFTLPEASDVSIRVHSITGRVVASSSMGAQEGGHHMWKWDGMNLNGSPVVGGVYFVTVQAGEHMYKTKLTRTN